MATYSTVTEAGRVELERAYGLEITTLTPLPGGMANPSFRCETDRGVLVVSILDNHDEVTATRLVRAGEWMRTHGIPTNEIIPRRDGALLSALEGTPVVVRRWLPGRTDECLPADRLPAAGRLLAGIHGCPPDGLDAPRGARRLGGHLRAVLDDFPDQAHARWVRRRLTALDRQFPPADDPREPRWTPVHGDFHPPNLVVSAGGTLSVIDWETVAVDDPMLDIGLAVLGLCRDGDRLDRRRLDTFRGAYVDAGGPLTADLLGPAIEYAAVILSFHRYRRHNMRYPNPARSGYFREMVSFVEHEYPAT